MPFDASPVDSEVVTVLKKARALIENEADWRPKAAMAGPFCTLGAIWFIADRDCPWSAVAGRVQAIFRNAVGIDEFASIGEWNDAQEHPSVLAAFDKAIILAGGTP